MRISSLKAEVGSANAGLGGNAIDMDHSYMTSAQSPHSHAADNWSEHMKIRLLTLKRHLFYFWPSDHSSAACDRAAQ